MEGLIAQYSNRQCKERKETSVDRKAPNGTKIYYDGGAYVQ